MARVRPVLALLALLTAEAGAVVGLWRLGARSWAAIDVLSPSRWLAATPPGDALAAVLRLVALAVAVHLLWSTAVYVAARCSGVPSAVRAVQWLTMPAVRRLADRAVAVALTTGTALGGPSVGLALASEAPGPVVATVDVVPADMTAPAAPELAAWVPGLVRADRAGAADAGRPGPGILDPNGPVPDPGAAVADPARGTVTALVEPGDNLWALSARQLGEATGRAVADLDDREVHAYWTVVLAANRDRLPSADPDLLRPGDRVTLPPVVANP